MKNLEQKVAVVTGAASGIGLALAERFASERMKLVLADVEPDALESARVKLAEAGADVLAVQTDVSKSDEVDRLRAAAVERFGAVHVVCNNAGVGTGGPLWEHSLADWQWLLGVNLWGVIHGVKSFVPQMLGQGEGHIVNTASIAGLITGPGMSIYAVTKHAVVALTECLHHELQALDASIGVSVLCPGWVQTRIVDSERNRPASAGPSPVPVTPQAQMMDQMTRHLVATGIPAASVAEAVVNAIRERRFWVFTHPEFKASFKARFDAILEERNPEPLLIM